MEREIQVKVKDKTKPENQVEPTIEERILKAAVDFRSQKSRDIEHEIINALEDNYESMILETIGLERDTFNKSWRLRVYHNNEFTNKIRDDAKAAARRLVEGLDFSKIELTTPQLTAIRQSYNSELKHNLNEAARQLAREDARRVAAKVLGLPED